MYIIIVLAIEVTCLWSKVSNDHPNPKIFAHIHICSRMVKA